MLTNKQRELIENGKIRKDTSTQIRVRNNIDESLKDLNLVLRNYKWIEGQNEITDFIDQDNILQLITNLLYIIDDDMVDDNLIWILVESIDDCWTVEGSDYIHGRKQEVALAIFMKSFKDYIGNEEMKPNVEDIDGWKEFEMLYEEIKDDGIEVTYEENKDTSGGDKTE